METNTMDIALTLISLIGLFYVFLRLTITVIPLQVKEARVVNGLAKLRRQLLISGISIMTVAFVGLIMLLLSLMFPRNGMLMEILVVVLVIALIVNAETKHAIYHQQYTPEHKELSRKIQHEIDEGG